MAKKRRALKIRRKISASLKKYYKKKSLEVKRLALKRSLAAKKGWGTRRKDALKRARKVKALPELISKTLYDGHAEDLPTEHFWSNIRHLAGDSISNQLSRIPAEEGNLRVFFRLVDADVFSRAQEEDGEEVGEFGEGEEVPGEWDTDLDPDEFWSTYFDHAREFLPRTPEGKTDGTKALLVSKLVISYAPGQISTD